jgi:hypothetical protein
VGAHPANGRLHALGARDLPPRLEAARVELATRNEDASDRESALRREARLYREIGDERLADQAEVGIEGEWRMQAGFSENPRSCILPATST